MDSNIIAAIIGAAVTVGGGLAAGFWKILSRIGDQCEADEELFGRIMLRAKSKSVQVSFEPRPQQDPEIKGIYFGKTIWVRPEEPRAQQLKTLLHEMAHFYSEGIFRILREDAETIAESVAFTVGAHFNFDTGTRSFPYVALWSRDKKVLERNLGAIRRIADSIIGDLEK